MQDIGKEIGGYVLSLILIIAGALFTFKYLSAQGLEAQPGYLLLGGLFLIIVGVIALPMISSKIGAKLSKILLAVGLVSSGFLGYAVYTSIDEEIQFLEDQKVYNARTIQSLKDIRLSQEAYKNFHGGFTNNWDSLADFIMKPSIPIIYKQGIMNDTIEGGLDDYIEFGWVLKRSDLAYYADSLGFSEEEFSEMIKNQDVPYIVIDTSYVSVWDEHFRPEIREEEDLPLVSLDEMPFNPLHGERYLLSTNSVNQGGVQVSTILVQDPKPFPYEPPYPFGRDKMKKDTLRFGSLTDAHTDGNWRK